MPSPCAFMWMQLANFLTEDVLGDFLISPKYVISCYVGVGVLIKHTSQLLLYTLSTANLEYILYIIYIYITRDTMHVLHSWTLLQPCGTPIRRSYLRLPAIAFFSIASVHSRVFSYYYTSISPRPITESVYRYRYTYKSHVCLLACFPQMERRISTEFGPRAGCTRNRWKKVRGTV